MIAINNLKPSDVGRWVRYCDIHFPHQSEDGRIKSWNEHTVFVVYRCNEEWDRFMDFTAAGSLPESLEFITELREAAK